MSKEYLTNPINCGNIVADRGSAVILCLNKTVDEPEVPNWTSSICSKTVFPLEVDMRNDDHNKYVQWWRKRNIEKARETDRKTRLKIKDKLMFNYTKKRFKAKNRGIEFNLTMEEFSKFRNNPCAYCGKPTALYGIDRTDNSKGYSIDNVKSCCLRCNSHKSRFSEEEFLRRNPDISNGIYWDSNKKGVQNNE